jgi:PAS domain S-box-containing protein
MTEVPPTTSLDDLKAEPFLAALVRSSDDAMIGKAPDGQVVLWGGSAEQLYGYQAAEMLGRDISVLVPPERPFEIAYIMGEVMQGRTVRGFQTERLRKDGALVPVSVTVSPVLDDDGTVVGASTTAHDLSQEVDHVRALREAERRAGEALSTLETLQSSAPIGLGFVDREFRMVHLNEALAVISGSGAKDQIGRTVAEIVPEIWPQVEGVYRHVLDNDEAVLNIAVTGELAAEPGGQRHWLASYYPVHLGAEVIGVGIVVVDVTEQRQADEFRSVALNQMAEGLIATDGQGRTTYMNGAATRMLGWTEADLKGKGLHDIIHTQREDGAPILSKTECGHDKVRAKGGIFRANNEMFTCKNGSVLPVAYSVATTFSGTVGDGAVMVFRDFTEEKAERLRVKRELAAVAWLGRIREALDDDKLVLYSQPIVPLSGGQPSEELLLRMLGRDGEVIAPGAFLPVAEKYGLITEIDQWVLNQAVRLAATGRHVSVNLSAESIVSLDMVAIIDR